MGLLTNPFFAAGAGLLQASGPSPHPVNPWGGITQGLLAAQVAQQQEQEAAAQQMRMQALQQDMERRAQLDQWAASQGDPLARIAPEQYAQGAIEKQFASPEAPSEWISLPDGTQRLVTAQEAANIPGAVPYKTPAADDTSAQRDYQFAVQQGYKGSFFDFKRDMAQAGATNVNVDTAPKLPSGYMWTDPSNPAAGVVPIPGSPSAFEATETAATAAERDAGKAQQNAIAVGSIDGAIKILDDNFFSAGMASSFVPDWLAGTSKKDLSEKISTVQSAIGLERLLEIKAQGGTFGALSEKELSLLVNSMSSLNPEMSRTQLRENLTKVRDLLAKAGGGAVTPDGAAVSPQWGERKTVKWSDL